MTSPLRITILAINAVCFGGCLVLLALGTASGPLVLLTIATGLSFGAGLMGAIVASRELRGGARERDGVRRDHEPSGPDPGVTRSRRLDSDGCDGPVQIPRPATFR
jgi:hypothetical protein